MASLSTNFSAGTEMWQDTPSLPEGISSHPKRRTRKSHQKSRQGCARCKEKRMKCDETRPACKNCLKAGHQCPGFQQLFRWSGKHERYPLADASSSAEIPQLDGDTQQKQGQPDLSTSFEDLGSHFPTTNENLFSSLEVGDALWQLEPPSSSVDASLVPGYGLQHPLPSELMIPPTLEHLPTNLIEHWFQFVCPTWSVFDSEVNYNRQLAQTSWTVSEPVFFAMQAMAAACLAQSMPQLQGSLFSLRQQAVVAISNRVSQIQKPESARVTPDLVFAVFALGTSLHWSTPVQAEYPWTQLASRLLAAWQKTIEEGEKLLHAYFCQALTYWEMLRTAMEPHKASPKLDQKRKQHRRRLRQALNLPISQPLDSESMTPSPEPGLDALAGTRPNSWCGVSNEVIEAFAQTMELCRSADQRATSGVASTIEATSAALCDVSLAHELERQLKAMDFGTIISTEEALGFSVHTRDQTTPLYHLLLTAEAYRQAALLQLHQAFEDLGLDLIQSRAESLLSASLKLADMLKEIPAESGSSSMHPMLYLCAATGLTFDACIDSPGVTEAADLLFEDLPLEPFFVEPLPHTRPGDLTSGLLDAHGKTVAQVNDARQLVRERLGAIQQRMPQRVRGGMLQLVEAMWLEYDATQGGSRRSHWFDVWTRTGLGVILS